MQSDRAKAIHDAARAAFFDLKLPGIDPATPLELFIAAFKAGSAATARAIAEEIHALQRGEGGAWNLFANACSIALSYADADQAQEPTEPGTWTRAAIARAKERGERFRGLLDEKQQEPPMPESFDLETRAATLWGGAVTSFPKHDTVELKRVQLTEAMIQLAREYADALMEAARARMQGLGASRWPPKLEDPAPKTREAVEAERETSPSALEAARSALDRKAHAFEVTQLREALKRCTVVEKVNAELVDDNAALRAEADLSAAELLEARDAGFSSAVEACAKLCEAEADHWRTQVRTEIVLARTATAARCARMIRDTLLPPAPRAETDKPEAIPAWSTLPTRCDEPQSVGSLLALTDPLARLEQILTDNRGRNGGLLTTTALAGYIRAALSRPGAGKELERAQPRDPQGEVR